MRFSIPRLGPLSGALLGVLLAANGSAHANDFPTSSRVLYVDECVRSHPGTYFEMVSKCSCVVDDLAAALGYDEFTTMQTIANGMSIGGERGGAIRDAPSLQPELKKYREMQAQARKACFLDEPK